LRAIEVIIAYEIAYESWTGSDRRHTAATLPSVTREEDAGRDAMFGLRSGSPLEDVRATLAAFGELAGDDRRTDELRAATGGRPDLSRSAHRDALLTWLRQWGCRHLRVSDHARSSRALLAWWRAYASDLPAMNATLDRLRPSALAAAGRAHAALAGRVAARRRHLDGEVDVVVGSTAAAKAMFALRPGAFPPWDEPIRAAFGWTGREAAHYEAYLAMSRDALDGLSRRAGVPVGELPRALGRPTSSPAKLVDEYLWMRLTHER
jgi:hypothetical protein